MPSCRSVPRIGPTTPGTTKPEAVTSRATREGRLTCGGNAHRSSSPAIGRYGRVPRMCPGSVPALTLGSAPVRGRCVEPGRVLAGRRPDRRNCRSTWYCRHLGHRRNLLGPQGRRTRGKEVQDGADDQEVRVCSHCLGQWHRGELVHLPARLSAAAPTTNRKVGGSTPPLATPSERHRRRSGPDPGAFPLSGPVTVVDRPEPLIAAR
jgi:hypothetical protein